MLKNNRVLNLVAVNLFKKSTFAAKFQRSSGWSLPICYFSNLSWWSSQPSRPTFVKDGLKGAIYQSSCQSKVNNLDDQGIETINLIKNASSISGGLEYLARSRTPHKQNQGSDRNYSTDSDLKLVLLSSANQNELKLKCTEFDHFGNVRNTAGEFSKHHLCSIHGLQPRDLRKIDSTYANQLPAILVREQAILVNLLQIKALVKADLVVLFDSIGASYSRHHSLFIYDLQERLRPNSAAAQTLPFEFRALESILISVVSTLQSEMEVISSLVSKLLVQLEDTIDRDKLKQLLACSKRLFEFEQKVLNIKGAIEEVLEQDEDLAAMYLSSKKAGTARSTHNHEEIELLMETYLKQTDEIANVIGALRSDVRTTEDIVNIILDSQRNSLLLLELQVTMGTLGLTMGAFIASLFGMNLTNHLETDSTSFYVVTSCVLAMVSLTTLIFIRRMKKLVRQI